MNLFTIGAPVRRPVRRGCRGLLPIAVLVVVAALAGPAQAAEGTGSAPSSAVEPPTVPADKPYQLRGVIEWVDLAGHRIVVDGREYAFHHPLVHRPADAPGNENRNYQTPRLRPGMTVGLKVARGTPPPVVEVWILR